MLETLNECESKQQEIWAKLICIFGPNERIVGM